ncbi:MAG: 3-deoxy-D-manno-octulosonic acid transferase [Roseobacter sp.]
MARSLGFSAYRALKRRSEDRSYVTNAKRPQGQLLWIHAAEAKNLLAIVDLAHRICAVRYDLHVLITLPDQKSLETAQKTWTPNARIGIECCPSEHPDAVKAFWWRWSPDMAVWSYGNLRPNLLEFTHRKKCPIALIDADKSGFDGRRDRWLPDLSRHLLDPFQAILVRSSDTLRRLESLGVHKNRVEITPHLQAGGYTLPCEDSDLSDLGQTLSGRPVWLANTIQAEEIEPVLKAHRQAVRLSHRLLLILNLAEEELLSAFSEQVEDENFRIADWSSGDPLDDGTQVLLVSDAEDLGLFYRLAPVTFMGGSMVRGHQGRNPFEAAALGSAVLYGPNVRHYMPFYARLAKAGAAQIVKDGETLGAAVIKLIAPDQAAAMAIAGWDVVSEGADLTDRVIGLVHATLDGDADMTNARP